MDDNFEILRLLGSGGQGETVLARQRSSGAQVAIKRIKADSFHAANRALEEANQMQRLRHELLVELRRVFLSPLEFGRFQVSCVTYVTYVTRVSFQVSCRHAVTRVTYGSDPLEFGRFLVSCRHAVTHVTYGSDALVWPLLG